MTGGVEGSVIKSCFIPLTRAHAGPTVCPMKSEVERDVLQAVEAAMSEVEPRLAKLAAAAAAANQILERTIADERRRNTTWADIAAHLGLDSQQAARQRYLRLEPQDRRKSWLCPLPDPRSPEQPCGTVATYRHNLRKHLTGTRRYGGHELVGPDADRLLDSLEQDA